MIKTRDYQYEHKLDIEGRILAKDIPETNGSDWYYDETIGEFTQKKPEPFILTKREIYDLGINNFLSQSAMLVLLAIEYKANRWRNTRARNKIIFEIANVKEKTGKLALRELEFYNIIKRRRLPDGQRIITLLRGETTIKKLKEEGKLAYHDNKPILIKNEPLEKEREKRKKPKG